MVVLETALAAEVRRDRARGDRHRAATAGALRRHRSLAATVRDDAGRRRCAQGLDRRKWLNRERRPPTVLRKPAMLSLDDAVERLLGQVRPPAPERAESVSTFDALGRVLAEDVRSLLDVPPADNSEMDGYALRAADVAEPGTVPARQPADRRRQRRHGPRAGHRRADLHRRPGARRRRRGRDAGALRRRSTAACASMPRPSRGNRSAVVARTCSGTPPCCAPVCASRRRRSAWPPRSARRCSRCGARPRVALFSTGDELAMPGDTLKPGAIYNSNRFTLRGLIQAMGGVCEDLGIVPDRLDATRETLRRAAARQRPDRHLRRHVGRRRGPHEAGGRAGRAARHVADRDQAGQAAGLRRGLPRRRLVGLVHRPAGQSGVGVRDLPVRRAAGAAAPAGRDRPRAPADRDARRLRLAARRPRGASSCGCAATPAAAWICFRTRARRC